MRYSCHNLQRVLFVALVCFFLGSSQLFGVASEQKAVEQNSTSYAYPDFRHASPDPVFLEESDSSSEAEKVKRQKSFSVAVYFVQVAYVPQFKVISCRSFIPALKHFQITRPRLPNGPPAVLSA